MTDTATSTSKRNGYSLDADLEPIIKGEVPLPNFEPMDVGNVINTIAACGHSMVPKWGYAKVDGHKDWAQYFLTHEGMSSRNLGGGGYVLIYQGKWKGEPRVGRFAICKHEKELAPSANPSRGWHPGACKKCGLDMTVDSGD